MILNEHCSFKERRYSLPKTIINIKEDILMVTRQLLQEKGYEKLNMRTIAAKCGIATGTLYNYYKSKQEIVCEVLRVEWSMMLRRIDQATKSNSCLMNKLEIIYDELGILMNNVHNIWFDFSGINSEKSEFYSFKHHKNELLKSLSDKILILIKGSDQSKDIQCKDYELIADAICKLFVLYVYEDKMEFARLSCIIESMLN